VSKKKTPVESNGVHHAAGAEAPAPVPAEDLAPASGGNGEKRPPAHTVRIGRLKVTVWINHAKDGKPFYGVTTARVYRNADGEYAQAYSFDRSDLLPLAEALRLAFLWIAGNPLSYDDDTPF
jgi:hypothetical protein